jgi:hypothetical protein
MGMTGAKWRGFVAAAIGLSLMSGAPLKAEVVSDQAAAILIWPDVTVIDADVINSGAPLLDTIIQLSNTSAEPILAHCFYENANYHCSNNGQVCIFAEDCCDPSTGCGLCEPGWLETDFWVRLTPRQPLGWVASDGLSEFPLPGGVGGRGPDGSSNAGSRVPPVAEAIYNGALKCIAVNDDGTPSDRNVLKGEATRIFAPDGQVTVSKHNAIGIRAIEGAVNDDRELILGGAEAEYEGCPEILIVNHLFDNVQHPAIDAVETMNYQGEQAGFGLLRGLGGVTTRLTLVPCTQDLLRQIPGDAVVQYLVYNEFEQRFSTSRRVDCKFESVLSTIDTTDRERSIFSAGVAGTVVGQSRLRAIGSGLVGIATEGVAKSLARATMSGGLSGPPVKVALETPKFGFVYLSNTDIADVNIHQQGDRAEADVITLP